MTQHASPEFRYLREIHFACTYALSNPELAYDCAELAMWAAEEAQRPDLAYYANELMSAIGEP